MRKFTATIKIGAKTTFINKKRKITTNFYGAMPSIPMNMHTQSRPE